MRNKKTKMLEKSESAAENPPRENPHTKDAEIRGLLD